MLRLPANESPFQVTLKGVAAGLVGTLVMTSVLQVVARLVARPSDAAADRDEAAELTSLDAAPQLPPTEQVAERLAGRVFGAELSRETRQRLGLGIHWAYGATWGAIAAPLLLAARPPALPYGVALGIAVWAVGPARLVPALGLYERPATPSIVRRVLAVSLHVVYGVATALTLERLSPPR